MGPIVKTFIHGHRYFLTIVDDFSRFLWIILLIKTKSKVPSHVKNFIQLIYNHHNITPKFIRSTMDLNFSFLSFMLQNGLFIKKSCDKTPQQNGRVERKHQHILNVARELLYTSKLPNIFWSYVVLHAAFLINRVLTPILKN
jgi:hypothetical protein